MVKRARTQSGPFHGLCGYAVEFRAALDQAESSEAPTAAALRGIALRERDEGGDLGQCLHVLHEDGMVRAWTAADVQGLQKIAENTPKLDRKQLKLREDQRPFYRGSVAARQRYYNDQLTPGTALEVWRETDHAWCEATVVEAVTYYDKQAQTLGAVRVPFVNVSFAGADGHEGRGAIELDNDVWRLAGETLHDEMKRQDHRMLLSVPEAGTSVTRAFASPCVTLAQQMDPQGATPSVVLSGAVAVLTQICKDADGGAREKRVVVELPVQRDTAAGLDASFDDRGVVKVVYVAKDYDVLGSGADR